MKQLIALSTAAALALGGLNFAHAGSEPSSKKSAQETAFMTDAQLQNINGARPRISTKSVSQERLNTIGMGGNPREEAERLADRDRACRVNVDCFKLSPGYIQRLRAFGNRLSKM